MAVKTRAPHKEGCMCVVCKRKSAGLESQPLVEPEITPEPEIVAPPLSPPLPAKVRLDSLLSTNKFLLGGQEHRVGEKIEGMVVCYNLTINDTATLSGSTMVKLIK